VDRAGLQTECDAVQKKRGPRRAEEVGAKASLPFRLLSSVSGGKATKHRVGATGQARYTILGTT
jgi:hypothetical protein